MSEKKGGPGRNQGRKKKPDKMSTLSVRIRPDQAEWLSSRDDKAETVREAIDLIRSQI